jgi:hypothetical protein
VHPSPAAPASRARGRARTRARRAAALLLAAGVVALLAAPAAAAAYRFWGYFQWDGTTWVFARQAPAETVPADGAVEGWRFAVGDEAATKLPRAAGDFALICGDTAAADGQKRVAVVVDYGTPADAAEGAGEPPAARGACAVVDEQATGSETLAAVADQRVENGLVCGVDGWPASGCGEPVAGTAPADPTGTVTLALPQAAATGDAGATADSQGESGQSPNNAPWMIAAGVVAAAGVGVWAWARLRPHGEDEQGS